MKVAQENYLHVCCKVSDLPAPPWKKKLGKASKNISARDGFRTFLMCTLTKFAENAGGVSCIPVFRMQMLIGHICMFFLDLMFRLAANADFV